MVNGLDDTRLPESLWAWFSAVSSTPLESELAFAPGRVNLIGAHLDYNEGMVQPVALDRGTFVICRPRSDDRIGLISRDDSFRGDYSLADLPPTDQLGWCAYPIGLATVLGQDGYDVGGLDLYVAGNLPIGAGLSSSASILVATARALDHFYGWGLTDEQVALLAYRAENEFVGVSCGIMDPMASAIARPGCSLYLDCRDRSYEHVPFDFDRMRLVLIDSGTRRTLANSRFNDRVRECREAADLLRRHRPELRTLRDATLDELEAHASELPAATVDRARHVIREVERVGQFKVALAARDFVRCGQLISECHADLKRLYAASTDQLDFLAETASATEGVLGARLAGAGWGGCVVAVVERGAEEGLVTRLQREYPLRFQLEPKFHVFG